MLFLLQTKIVQDTSPALKDVSLVIDSLKKHIAAERCISVEVQFLTYDCIVIDLILHFWTLLITLDT